MSAFEDWLESLDLKLEENVPLNMAYIAGRAHQLEVDAKIASEFNPNGSWGSRIEKAIREQKID